MGFSKSPFIFSANSNLSYYDVASRDLGSLTGNDGSISKDGNTFYFFINNVISIYKKSGTTYSSNPVGP